MLYPEDLTIENVLSEWRHWGTKWKKSPEIIRAFSSGLTNRSYLIRVNGAFYKLRINSPKSAQLGVNREREQGILQGLAHLGFTPQLLYSSPTYSYSLFEYIEGEPWTKASTLSATSQQKITDLIRRYQQVQFKTTDSTSADLYTRNYIKYFNEYEKQLKPSALTDEEWERFFDFKESLQRWQNQQRTAVLCHHDLLPENIIEQENRLYILDWEYAAVGCGDLDFLSIGCRKQVKDAFSQALFFWLNTLWFKLQQ